MMTPWKEFFTDEPADAAHDSPTLTTLDLYVAAYLVAHDVEILRTEPGRFATFYFDRIPAEPLMDSYNRGGKVNAQKYAAAIRYVKRLIHGAR